MIEKIEPKLFDLSCDGGVESKGSTANRNMKGLLDRELAKPVVALNAKTTLSKSSKRVILNKVPLGEELWKRSGRRRKRGANHVCALNTDLEDQRLAFRLKEIKIR